MKIGVTTNSSSGVVDYTQFFPVFAQMEKEDLLLNLHGEKPATPGSDITVLNAEEHFLPTLLMLHKKFPKLRIILEHCTSAKAIEAVKSCGPTVAATITGHHLFLTMDDVVADPFCFCKPGMLLFLSGSNQLVLITTSCEDTRRSSCLGQSSSLRESQILLRNRQRTSPSFCQERRKRWTIKSSSGSFYTTLRHTDSTQRSGRSYR